MGTTWSDITGGGKRSASGSELVEHAKQTKILSLENRAHGLPKSADDLSDLRTIALSRVTGIHDLPKCVGQSASTLKVLRLRFCGLTSLSSTVLASLINLKELDLSGNALRSIDFMLLPKSLEKLYLSQNAIDTALEGGSQLKNLVVLDLSKNPALKDISNLAFDQFKSLEELNLEATSLVELPSNISKCPRLTTLSIANNKLTSIPPEILAESPCLHTIHLEGNLITEKQFMELPGVEAYLARRKERIDKQIAGGTYKPDLRVM